MAVTLPDVDKQLLLLCQRREKALAALDMADLYIVSELIDGWLAQRTALTTSRIATAT